MQCKWWAWMAASSVLVGCGDAPAVATDDVVESEPIATVVFDEDFGERLDGSLIAGGELRIEYAPERLADCEGWQGGNPVWSITGFSQLGDGEPQTFAVLDPNHPEGYVPVLPLDEPGELALWFQATNIWGCLAWDSDFGENYRFEIGASD